MVKYWPAPWVASSAVVAPPSAMQFGTDVDASRLTPRRNSSRVQGLSAARVVSRRGAVQTAASAEVAAAIAEVAAVGPEIATVAVTCFATTLVGLVIGGAVTVCS